MSKKLSNQKIFSDFIWKNFEIEAISKKRLLINKEKLLLLLLDINDKKFYPNTKNIKSRLNKFLHKFSNFDKMDFSNDNKCDNFLIFILQNLLQSKTENLSVISNLQITDYLERNRVVLLSKSLKLLYQADSKFANGNIGDLAFKLFIAFPSEIATIDLLFEIIKKSNPLKLKMLFSEFSNPRCEKIKFSYLIVVLKLLKANGQQINLVNSARRTFEELLRNPKFRNSSIFWKLYTDFEIKCNRKVIEKMEMKKFKPGIIREIESSSSQSFKIFKRAVYGNPLQEWLWKEGFAYFKKEMSLKEKIGLVMILLQTQLFE
ncbi:hypothetical protein MHBO_001237 [Bonamia ostreae]